MVCRNAIASPRKTDDSKCRRFEVLGDEANFYRDSLLEGERRRQAATSGFVSPARTLRRRHAYPIEYRGAIENRHPIQPCDALASNKTRVTKQACVMARAREALDFAAVHVHSLRSLHAPLTTCVRFPRMKVALTPLARRTKRNRHETRDADQCSSAGRVPNRHCGRRKPIRVYFSFIS